MKTLVIHVLAINEPKNLESREKSIDKSNPVCIWALQYSLARTKHVWWKNKNLSFYTVLKVDAVPSCTKTSFI